MSDKNTCLFYMELMSHDITRMTIMTAYGIVTTRIAYGGVSKEVITVNGSIRTSIVFLILHI